MGDRLGLALDLASSTPDGAASSGVEIVALQPIAIVDHLLTVSDEGSLRSLGVDDELGGSHRVTLEEVRRILAEAGEYYSRAGGSAANTTRGLAGFGVHARLVGARGQDEWGVLFSSSMGRAGVDVSRVLAKPVPTARCCILSAPGQRTMRTAIAGSAALDPGELDAGSCAGAGWLFASAYAAYIPGMLDAAVRAAQAAGARLALDLASFEVVRAFRPTLRALLESGAVALCFANEDEACEVVGERRGADEGGPLRGLAYLAAHCDTAVVTLGERGCVVRSRGSDVVHAQPACTGVRVVDATGAGDLFAAGFLYGTLRGAALPRCAEIGCMAGGAVVQTLGAEMTNATWEWLHSRLHGELAGAVVRDSAAAVQQELLACYALIERLGRGVVYYGSARLRRESPHWRTAVQLGEQVARLLGSTTWSGGGPGMMEAATEGALAAGGTVGGIKISREAGTSVRTAASYLPADAQVYCRFLAPRKVALVDCAVRPGEADRTAYVFLPGGLGTMDELFELLTLAQLGKLGSKHPVPIILCNYDGFYTPLMAWLKACDGSGVLKAAELGALLVADDNAGVLDALAQHYGLPRAPGAHASVRAAAEWMQDA
ncbi:putative sugar kinase [Auxenochlorella protothecoides]|uniref:Putative sugar kinase n=3 Tax=Auxenochlorella protothecoides TaxID=3075 RepID=A0A087SHX8_AUXPR|nr:putative sugar kinase [Auxenochlorella protothecoides]KFM25332.1 putative sugar kinase [Auxenochlorella protothecoides]